MNTVVLFLMQFLLQLNGHQRSPRDYLAAYAYLIQLFAAAMNRSSNVDYRGGKIQRTASWITGFVCGAGYSVHQRKVECARAAGPHGIKMLSS